MNKWCMAALVAGTVAVAGCVDLSCVPRCAGTAHNSSSLVDFLYPNGLPADAPDAQPRLRIPLRVGLAFLPSAALQPAVLDEAHKAQLLERIKQRFASRRFVSEIVLIPDYYLAAPGSGPRMAGRSGFAGLEAVQRLYGLDVIALVSFDQDTHLDSNDWSLAYLTVVGAYLVKGSRHDVSTLVDLAVVDPATRRLVIRTGGTDLRHGNTTLIDTDRRTREADLAGFSAATDQMMDHFDVALTKFETDVKSGTASVRVESKYGVGSSGGGGGGALDGAFIALLALAMLRRAATQF